MSACLHDAGHAPAVAGFQIRSFLGLDALYATPKMAMDAIRIPSAT